MAREALRGADHSGGARTGHDSLTPIRQTETETADARRFTQCGMAATKREKTDHVHVNVHDHVHVNVHVDVEVDVDVNVDGSCHAKILSRRAMIFGLSSAIS